MLSVRRVYIRTAQGPQIFSTPGLYIDLADVPLQYSHKDIYNRRMLVKDTDLKSLPPCRKRC